MCIRDSISPSDSKAERGLGIGLALGRRLAEAHGGTLTGTSDGEGCGSTFALVLPRLEGAEEVTNEPEHGEASAPMAALDIVVIEDSQDVADTLVAWLAGMG